VPAGSVLRRGEHRLEHRQQTRQVLIDTTELSAVRPLPAALSMGPQTAEQIADRIGAPESTEAVYLLLEHLAANDKARMSRTGRSRLDNLPRK
jgi:hypothetical protein